MLKMGARQIPTEAYALGPQVAEFKAKHGRLVVAVLLAIAGGLFYLPAGYAILKGSRGDTFAVLGFGLVFVAVAAAIAVRHLRTQRGRRVLVFQDGLVEIRPNKSSVLRWDDVGAVWQKSVREWHIHGFIPIPMGTRHTYTIRQRSGDVLVFADDVKNVAQLGKIIQTEVTKWLLPEAAAAIRAGGTVQFGELLLSPLGLGKGQQTIPWDEVESVKLQHGVIAVRRRGQSLYWARVKVERVPNVFVLMALLDHMTSPDTGSAEMPVD